MRKILTFFIALALVMSVFNAPQHVPKAHAAVRINHLGIAGKGILGSTVSPPNLKNGLVGHWTFDGPDMNPNVRDKSGQGNHGTLTNFISTTTESGRLGQGLSFASASSQYVTMGDLTSLNPGSSNYTMSYWFKTGTQQFAPVVSKRDGAGNNFPAIQSGVGQFNGDCSAGVNSGSVFVVGRDGSSSNSTAQSAYYTTNTGYADGKWHHVSAVYSSGGTAVIYVDSMVQSTTRPCSAAMGSIAPAASFNIGFNNGASYFNGITDDVRVYNRAVTASEVSQLYKIGAGQRANSTVTPPNLQSGLVGHWTFDGPDMIFNVRDKSGQGNHGTLSGYTSTTTVPGKFGQALSFDGTNDGVNVTGNSASDVASNGDITVSAWVKTTDSYCPIYSSRDGGGNPVYLLAIGYDGVTDNAGKLQQLVRYDDSSGLNDVISSASVHTGKWIFVTAILSQSGDYMRNYINATLDGSETYTSNGALTVSDNPLPGVGIERYWVANIYETADKRYCQGVIDDVRIYNRALSAAEILQLYNLGR